MPMINSKLKRPKITFSLVLLWIFILIALVPFYIMIIGSLKPNTALFKIPPDILPFNFVLDNFQYVFTKMKVALWYGNSIYISVMITAITVFVSACAGYAFAKMDFYGKKVWFSILMATMMMPRQILMVPNFLVAKNFGLVNTLFGVVITSIAAPFGVFLCRQYMSTIPNELFQAAKIDGCSRVRIFWNIVIPLSTPALGALSIFSFITGWNDFVWQNIMISSNFKKTVPLAIAALSQEKKSFVGYQMAGAALASIPMLALFISMQKYFIKGITAGGVKG